MDLPRRYELPPVQHGVGSLRWKDENHSGPNDDSQCSIRPSPTGSGAVSTVKAVSTVSPVSPVGTASASKPVATIKNVATVGKVVWSAHTPTIPQGASGQGASGQGAKASAPQPIKPKAPLAGPVPNASLVPSLKASPVAAPYKIVAVIARSGITAPTVARSQSNPSTPANFVNPERLLDDITELYAARLRVIEGLDSLDAAARLAGTPIRSTSARERFADMASWLRETEAVARNAWHDELAAAGGMTANLRSILVKAGTSDARAIGALVAKDGLEIDSAEYDELLSVVEGAIVSAKESGSDHYAANLFASLDEVTLRHLTILLPKIVWATTPTNETAAKAKDLLSEL